MAKAKQDNQPKEEKWALVGLRVKYKDDGDTKSYYVKSVGWDMIFEEDSRFRVLKDKKDGTRVVDIIPKDALEYWSIDAKKAD